MSLSKSRYTKGLQCQKALWLHHYHPEWRAEPDEAGKARFAEGDRVGDLARQLFPGGCEIVFEPEGFEDMLEKTQRLLAEGVQTIYEASFRENDVFIACDILHKGKQGWELYEVKSATRVKETHRHDIAVQWYVLYQAGIRLSRAALIHINNRYKRQGGLDLQRLFKIEDVTEQTQLLQDRVLTNIKTLKSVLEAPEPAIPIGTHCNNPYACEFQAYCWRDVPEHSVLDLYRMNGDKRFALYNKGARTLDRIPPDVSLNAVQQRQVQAYKTGQVFVDQSVIRRFLDSLQAPLYFLDFESFQEAIPRFDGQKPWQQMPFQYSLHCQHEGRLEHREYLAGADEDPRRAIAQRLVTDLGHAGSIIAYNMDFEKRVIGSLAGQFPDLKVSLEALTARFADLMVPFRQGGYYTAAMKGSFSIKSVLPALFPDDPALSYKTLRIADGASASSTFAALHKESDPQKVAQIRDDLLAYCRLDTMAMVRILEFLKSQATV